MTSRLYGDRGPGVAASLARLALLLTMTAIAGCARQEASAPLPPPVPSPVEPRFTDVSEAAGIARVSQAYDATLGDYDGDGDVDVFVGGHGMPAALFRNDGNGHFSDVVAASGIE